MKQPLVVFIHGGQHTKACWDPTIEQLQISRPDIATLPLNLPGHGDEPGDLAQLTIRQCVDSVTENIRKQSPDSVVLVGHSMAGITLPGVATLLGAELVRHMVFVACCIPPEAKTVIDTLHPPMSFVARWHAKRNRVAKPMNHRLADWVFANGMSKSQKARMRACLCAESTAVTTEPVTRMGMPDIAKTWILPLRDRAVKPALQHHFIENLGGVDRLLELDTCHDAMISEPQKLAEMILQTVDGL
jgi:pimeloyl-ACP methyl ester carboxylesterase